MRPLPLPHAPATTSPLTRPTHSVRPPPHSSKSAETALFYHISATLLQANQRKSPFFTHFPLVCSIFLLIFAGKKA